MSWLLNLDVALFRFVNGTLSNAFFDQVMPFLSHNRLFLPAAALAAVVVIWRGRLRGGICVLMMVLSVALADGVLCRNLKRVIGRERPCLALAEARCLEGRSRSGSMPSAHAANWFAAAMAALVYYRRSARIMVPAAALVSVSRVYNGVHYPSDVLAGAVVGAGCAAAVVWSLNAFWGWAGRRWFPLWWTRMPSLLNPQIVPGPDEQEPAFAPRRSGAGGLVAEPPAARHAEIDAHWLRLGYVVIGVLLLARLAYIGSGTIQLSEDEAYQWLWSKHLDLSYYSKPPMIAYAQFLGTMLWGDNCFGVRFLSPVIAATLGVLLLRFVARHANARAGFFLLLVITATPLMAVGSVLMTVDPLSVLFWTAAMLSGWQAVQATGTTRDWLWTGLWMGLGFLSKYTQLFQLLCWAVFFVLWPPARKHLRRPGPWLALVVNGVCALPVLVWNYQREWVTVSHVADLAGAGSKHLWRWKFLAEFVGSEFALLNPVFFVAMIWAGIALWRRHRNHPLMTYLFSMGAPLFLAYLLHSCRSRVLPNWIAPSVLPLFCMMVVYWDIRWRLGAARLKPWLVTGLIVGFAMVILGHNTDLAQKMTGRYLPVNLDPLHRVRQWDRTARVVGEVWRELEKEGKPVFIIGNHYGFVSQATFWLPEAKKAAGDAMPLVYFRTSPVPRNQFYFWPGYTDRKGANAVFFQELDRDHPNPKPPPATVVSEFESVEDLGTRNVLYHGMLLRPIQFFACRGLK